MQSYHFYEEQAKGKSATIFKARRKKKLQFVAIKRLEKNRKNKILNEVQILHDINHPNIIKLYEYLQTKNHIWEVTQYCPGGDLLRVLEQDKSFTQNIVRGFIIDILKGLQHCHSRGIMVCDLKLASILLNQYGSCKIGDFGIAKDIKQMIRNQKQTKKGTPSYMAPQLFIQNGVYSFQSDLWAVGCMMYELAQGNPPFVSASYQQIAKLSANAKTPFVQQFSSDFNNLLQGLLMKDPEKRISWNGISKHPWIGTEIKNIQIPQQPHFKEYVRNKNSNINSMKLLRASQQLSKGEYGNMGSMNAKDKREQFVFESDDNNQNGEYTIVKQQQNYRDQKFEEQPSQAQLKQVSAFSKKNVKLDGRVLKAQPVFEDSTNVNSFLQKISRNQLLPIQELVHHPSDNTVKPIIGNKDIQVIQSFNFNKNKLGFSYVEPDTLAEAVVNGDMEMELQNIFKGMSGQNKENVLGYFQSIIQNSDIANYLFKQEFIKFYLKLIRNYNKPSLKAKMYEILGFLVRHATIIQPGVLKEGIIQFFMEGATKQKSQIVRRKAMAALGQLLFYGATQVDEGVTEWDTGLSTISGLQKILKNENEDLIVRVYCCKTIQNITAQSKDIGTKFAQQDTILALIKSMVSTKNQGFRTSLCCCLHHILQLNGSLKQMTLQKLGISNLIQILKSQQISSKSIQILLWIMINQFIKSKTSKVSRMLLQNQTLFRIILHKLDRVSSSVVKGRIYVYSSYFLQNNPKKCILLLQNNNDMITINHNKLFIILQKQLQNEQKPKYETQSLQYLLVWLYQNFKNIIKYAQQQIKLIVQKIQLRQDGSLAKNVGYSGILYHMLNYKPFEQLFQQQSTAQQLFSIMILLDSIPAKAYENAQSQQSGGYLLQQIKNTYFQVVQKYTDYQKYSMKLQQYYSTKIMPWLVGRMLKSQHQDIRYNSIKYFIFLVTQYNNQTSLYDSTVFSTTTSKVSSLIANHLMPSIDVMLAKKQSQLILAMTFKLLALLFQSYPALVRKFVQLQKVNVLIDNGHFNIGTNSMVIIIIRRCLQSEPVANNNVPAWISKVFTQINKMLMNIFETNQQRSLDEILNIYAQLIRINGNGWKQQDIQKIWEKILPLQGNEDIVIGQKAEKVISGILTAGRYGSKGKWDIKSKPGINNYQSYLKLSGKPQDPKVRQNINQVIKNRYG